MGDRGRKRMSIRAISAVAAAAALLIALGALAAPAPNTPAVRGRALVERNCSMCHAVGRSGESPNPAAPHFRDLNQRYPVSDLGEALGEGIITRHPQMPQFRFSDSEVSDILAYLQSIQTRQHVRAGSRASEHG
jgi:mono/diheme cytochrome c family protein